MGTEDEADVVVVGAGAAGLWAAERAARGGARVLLLEKTPRTGTKVLASGGTRCNLTTTLAPEAAAETFGPAGARFLRGAFRALTPAAVRERFLAWGVPTVEAPLDKVFPESGRARDVRDALEREARAAGARVRLGAPVRAIEPGASGWTVVVGDEGERVRCARLLLCPGGKSYARTGTTGDGYAWLASLDLQVVEPVPALAPLSSPAAWVRELAGIAVQDAEVRLTSAAGKELGRRRRPVLFTHRGVSGPGPMDLSVHVARGEGETFTLRLDLVPDVGRETLRAFLVEAAGAPGAPRLSRVLPVELPRRLLRAVSAAAGLGGDREPRANELSREARHALVETLKGLPIPIDGTLGFDQAEVTAGGLALHHVDPRTMQVRGRPGLFVFGELLDLAGPIGGLNFQAAFATAELAARAASGAAP